MSLTLLFDLDGTLLDSDPIHFRAYLCLLQAQARPVIDYTQYRTQIMGRSNAEIFQLLFPDCGPDHQSELAALKEEIYRGLLRDAVRESAIEAQPGALELLDWARDRQIRCGVVTNAPRENVTLMLAILRLAGRFDAVVLGEELIHAKPHPMPYRTALDRLEGHADRALAFEDSLSGVRSACGARIYTVGVSSSLSPEVLRAAGASHVIHDFRDAVLWAELRRRATTAPPPMS